MSARLDQAVTHAYWVRRNDVLWRWTLDGLLVLPAGREEPIVLERPGQALWQALREPRSLAEAVVVVSEEQGRDHDSVALELHESLEQLDDAGALRRLT